MRFALGYWKRKGLFRLDAAFRRYSRVTLRISASQNSLSQQLRRAYFRKLFLLQPE